MKINRISYARVAMFLILSLYSYSIAQQTTTSKINALKERISHGDAVASFSLGCMYQKGDGVKIDMKEAAKWFSVSTEKGNMLAAITLADIYLNGNGVNKNEAKAIELYSKIGRSNVNVAPFARCKLLLLARNYSLGENGKVYDKAKANLLFQHLLDIENYFIENYDAQMKESVQKFNEASDSLIEMSKKGEQK
jgi:TPR repeat protein